MPFVPEISAEFSATPEFSADVLEKDLSTGWCEPSTFKLQTKYSSTAPLHPYSEVSVASIMRLSNCFFIYWHQDFPAISVFTGRDFPALSEFTGGDFPTVSAVTGRGIFWRYLQYSCLLGFSGLNFTSMGM